MTINEEKEYLDKKRIKVLEKIKPLCDLFSIKYDYEIEQIGGWFRERLILNDTIIGCSSNSISAVYDELIGYIFVKRFCNNRHLGAFQTQTLNVIKRNWIYKESER